MNRQIKFRIWDVHEKKMRYLDKYVIDFDWFGATSNSYLDDSGVLDYPFKSSEYVLMQFTGIHDKNGREIYEGDNVKKGEAVMGVIFKQEACQFWLIYKDGDKTKRYEPLTATYGDDTNYFSNDSLEVVGNSYEN